jgi:hypothetical protein
MDQQSREQLLDELAALISTYMRHSMEVEAPLPRNAATLQRVKDHFAAAIRQGSDTALLHHDELGQQIPHLSLLPYDDLLKRIQLGFVRLLAPSDGQLSQEIIMALYEGVTSALFEPLPPETLPGAG